MSRPREVNAASASANADPASSGEPSASVAYPSASSARPRSLADRVNAATSTASRAVASRVRDLAPLEVQGRQMGQRIDLGGAGLDVAGQVEGLLQVTEGLVQPTRGRGDRAQQDDVVGQGLPVAERRVSSVASAPRAQARASSPLAERDRGEVAEHDRGAVAVPRATEQRQHLLEHGAGPVHPAEVELRGGRLGQRGALVLQVAVQPEHLERLAEQVEGLVVGALVVGQHAEVAQRLTLQAAAAGLPSEVEGAEQARAGAVDLVAPGLGLAVPEVGLGGLRPQAPVPGGRQRRRRVGLGVVVLAEAERPPAPGQPHPHEAAGVVREARARACPSRAGRAPGRHGRRGGPARTRAAGGRRSGAPGR